MINQSFLLARMRLIGLNTPLRVVTHWCGNIINIVVVGKFIIG